MLQAETESYYAVLLLSRHLHFVVCQKQVRRQHRAVLPTYQEKSAAAFTHYTESSKYYARIQTAVSRGLSLLAARLAGHHSDSTSKHSLCYFRSFSEQTVTRIDVHLESGEVSIY